MSWGENSSSAPPENEEEVLNEPDTGAGRISAEEQVMSKAYEPDVDQKSHDKQDSTESPQSEDTQQHHNPEGPEGSYKIFIGGLSRNTTSETVREYFSKFGKIMEAAVVCEKETGRSRGFGFCTFETHESMQGALSAPHVLDGADLRVALPREENSHQDNSESEQPGRVFVGGLPDTVTEDSFREYFSKFGTLISSTLMYDKETNRPRGFGFVIYEDPNNAAKAIGPHESLGKACEAKKAHPRPRNGRRMQPGNRRVMRRGPPRGPDGYRGPPHPYMMDGYAAYVGDCYMPGYYMNPYARDYPTSGPYSSSAMGGYVPHSMNPYANSFGASMPYGNHGAVYNSRSHYHNGARSEHSGEGSRDSYGPERTSKGSRRANPY